MFSDELILPLKSDSASMKRAENVRGQQSHSTKHPPGLTLLKILAVTFFLRLSVSLLPHSGQAAPPTYGDFEAQRHWMSLTAHLPITEWYFHDSSWWRLDYPPLTAYHSYILGRLGTWLNPAWFDLDTSRGMETLSLKTFMRCTVLLSEALVFLPAVLIFSRLRSSKRSSRLLLAALLLQPGIILIDHGHFQYNTVMLGFFLLAICSFLSDFPLLGCGFFVAALGFKQMALFYAPAVASYLTGRCFFGPKGFQPFHLLQIVAVTALSFAVLYIPILLGVWHEMSVSQAWPTDYQPFLDQILQTLHRIFPLSRGLFEDKVANIWCTIHFSGLYKLHYSPAALQLAALCLTMAMILPPCLIIFLRPRKDLMMLAFTTCAWGFFLASYQVHEKNVLLPLVPMTALLADGKAATKAWVGFANIVGTWSLYHLLIKDDLTAAYFPLLGVWLYVMDLPPFNWSIYRRSESGDGLGRISKLIHLGAYAATAVWHLLQWTVAPPAGKPDLWIVVNMICSCAAFCACYAWCLGRLMSESGLWEEVKVQMKICRKGLLSS